MARRKESNNPEAVRYPKLTKELIHGFVSKLLLKNFDDPSPTPECHLEWWGLCCSDYRQIAIAAPRGHAKTSAITISYTLPALLFRDSTFAVVASDSVFQSAEFLRNIKDELSENEELKSLFGITDFIKDNEQDLIVQCEDKHQFRIMAKGSEQKVRGLVWRKKRPDLIVCDDLRRRIKNCTEYFL